MRDRLPGYVLYESACSAGVDVVISEKQAVQGGRNERSR